MGREKNHLVRFEKIVDSLCHGTKWQADKSLDSNCSLADSSECFTARSKATQRTESVWAPLSLRVRWSVPAVCFYLHGQQDYFYAFTERIIDTDGGREHESCRWNELFCFSSVQQSSWIVLKRLRRTGSCGASQLGQANGVHSSPFFFFLDVSRSTSIFLRTNNNTIDPWTTCLLINQSSGNILITEQRERKGKQTALLMFSVAVKTSANPGRVCVPVDPSWKSSDLNYFQRPHFSCDSGERCQLPFRTTEEDERDGCCSEASF